MKTIDNIKRLGGKGAAQQMYKDGQGQCSNPFFSEDPNHDLFAMEMSRLQQQELREMIGGCYEC